MQIEKNDIHKILLIKPRGIGDIVLSTIVLDSLNEYFSETKIDYLVEEFAKDAVKNIPLVNKVLTTDKSDSLFRIIKKIRSEKYDLVFDLYSNPRTAQYTFLSGAKYRVGFAYRGRKYAYNIKADSGRGEKHSAEHNLELLSPLNIPIISKKLQYVVQEDDVNFAKEFMHGLFENDRKIIGIIPSGGWSSKRCDKEKWVEICNEILKKYDAGFLILWGPGDEEDAQFIKNNLDEKATLAPPTTVAQLSGLIKNCDMVIANDSGPMHIAAAIGIPVLGIFGPTDPKQQGPYSPNSGYIIKDDLFCIICNKLECPYNHECMKLLPNELVLEKVSRLMV